MALRPPRISEAEDQNADSDRRAQPIRPVWQGVLIWLFGIGLLLVVVSLALRFLLVPALSGSSVPSAAEAHLSALQTQEALTPQPTAVPARAPTTAPTVAPTAVLVPAAAPTAQPQIATPAPAPTTGPTPARGVSSVVAPELAAEVSEAYLRYFQVSTDALRALNPDGLDSVATGDELQFLITQIEQDRSAGRALATNVQHSFVVLSVQGDQAMVSDDYRDSSIYVDPSTGQPPPGQVQPASPQDAPEIEEVYHLVRVRVASGTSIWKIERVDRYA